MLYVLNDDHLIMHYHVMLMNSYDKQHSMGRLKIYRGIRHPHIRQLPFPVTLPDPDAKPEAVSSPTLLAYVTAVTAVY
jgi:hypothetical protein